ncbi:MAG: hypothetical protein RR370_02630 [Synergistaceae bacterium]
MGRTSKKIITLLVVNLLLIIILQISQGRIKYLDKELQSTVSQKKIEYLNRELRLTKERVLDIQYTCWMYEQEIMDLYDELEKTTEGMKKDGQ